MLKIFSIFARPRRTRTTVYYIPDELPPYIAGETIPAGRIMPMSEESVVYSPTVPFDAWKVVNHKIVEGPKRKECLLYSHEIVAATISAPQLVAGDAHA